LGITLECIAPGNPQQNGRLERFHGTLANEVEAQLTIVEQQRAYDVFRRLYNFERPHSSLDMATPGTIYRRSPRKYPRPLLGSDYHPDHLERVDRRGFVLWRRQRIFIGEAFAGEYLALWPGDAERWEVLFGDITIGHLDGRTRRGFVPMRRPKGPMILSYRDEFFAPIPEPPGSAVDSAGLMGRMDRQKAPAHPSHRPWTAPSELPTLPTAPTTTISLRSKR